MAHRPTGVSTSAIEQSPARRRRQARRRAAEEKRWAARNGPVSVRFVEPGTDAAVDAAGEASAGPAGGDDRPAT